VSLRWGAFVPQGWKLEYAGLGAAQAWARSVEIAQQAESLGYDHLWVYDHVETVPRREPTHVFEAFTTLAAISQHTERVRLGQMVTCASYRNAGLLAKELACIDVFSGGRVILGLGAGWYSREYEAYGYDYLSDRERLRVLDEYLQVIPRLWSEETVSFDGTYVHLDGAYCDPKPLQDKPEIWVGGGGEQVTLRIAARHADKVNWQCSLEDFRRKDALLRGYCEEIGREDTIVRTWAPDCRIFDTERELDAWLEESGGNLWGEDGMPRDVYAAQALVGTVEQVVEKAQAYADVGVREFVLWFRDYPGGESLERVMKEVAPRL
jgi:F420-dependent oxidoreductase-like protein